MTLPADLEPLRMIREKEVGELAGVSLQTLRNWRSDPRKRSRGPVYFKLPGGGVRYRLADVLAWLDAGRVEAG